MSRLNPFTPYGMTAFGGPRRPRKPQASLSPPEIPDEFPGAPDPSAPQQTTMPMADAPFNYGNFKRRMLAGQTADAASTARAMTLLINARKARSIGDSMRADMLEQRANAMMGTDPNLGLRRSLASDANLRANELTGAQVMGMNAEARGIDADTRSRLAMLPIQQRMGAAQAAGVEIENQQAQQMMPFNVAAAGIRNQAGMIQNQQTAALTPFIPMQLQQEYQRGQLDLTGMQQQLQQQAKLFPLELESIKSGQASAAAQNEQLRKRNQFLESKLLQAIGGGDQIAQLLGEAPTAAAPANKQGFRPGLVGNGVSDVKQEANSATTAAWAASGAPRPIKVRGRQLWQFPDGRIVDAQGKPVTVTD